MKRKFLFFFALDDAHSCSITAWGATPKRLVEGARPLTTLGTRFRGIEQDLMTVVQASLLLRSPIDLRYRPHSNGSGCDSSRIQVARDGPNVTHIDAGESETRGSA